MFTLGNTELLNYTSLYFIEICVVIGIIYCMKNQFTKLKSSFLYGSDMCFIIKMILNCPLCIYVTAIDTEAI